MPASARARRKRSRGSVEEPPSGALRVAFHAGLDPLTGKRHYLREIIPPGPKATADAEKAMRRLAGQVDERRNPRTNATLNQLLDRYLETLAVSPITHAMYAKYLDKHVRPFVGKQKAGALGVRRSTRSMPSSGAVASTARAPGALTTARRGCTSATSGAVRTGAIRCRRRRSGTSTSSCAQRSRRACGGDGSRPTRSCSSIRPPPRRPIRSRRR